MFLYSYFILFFKLDLLVLASASRDVFERDLNLALSDRIEALDAMKGAVVKMARAEARALELEGFEERCRTLEQVG